MNPPASVITPPPPASPGPATGTPVLSRPIDWLFVLAVVGAVYWVVMVLGWAVFIDKFTEPRDWIMFHDAAQVAGTGDWARVYPGITPGLPFIYPPYALFLLWPLKFLTPAQTLTSIVLVSLLLLAASARLLADAVPGRGRTVACLFAIGLGSESARLMTTLGQPAPLFLFLLCAAFRLSQVGRPFTAGAVLALVMLKPNLGGLFVPLLLAAGDFRMAGGWAAGFLTLAGGPWFLHPQVWPAYREAMQAVPAVIAAIPPWRHHTVHAFLRSLLEPGHPGLVTPLWLATAIPLVLLTAWAWRVSRPAAGADRLRLWGLAALTAVVASPYLHHYDAIILLLPAVAWSAGASFRFSATPRLLGALMMLAFLLQVITCRLVQGGLSPVGPVLAICLAVDGADLIAGSRAGRRPA